MLVPSPNPSPQKQTSMSSSSSSSSAPPPSLVDSLFQRSLDDLIRSLRSAPPSSEPSVISSALSSSLRELRSSDPATKSTALSKLTYLSSLHHLPVGPTPFFPALELLPTGSHRRPAYLFATLHFHPSATDLLPLATHQLHKDLTSPHNYQNALALSLLSFASSPDLSRHLAPDLLPLLSSAVKPPAVRRKAIATALSVLTLSPDSVPVVFPKLVDNLSDPATISATVNVFCELTAADPRPYLPLAPDFYRILLESKNNWVLIKIVKIFARLAPIEPRLGKRMVDPICDLIRRSNAKSLVFECVRAVLSSFSEYEQAVRVAVEKVKEEFLSSEEDANLRYLGLKALSMLKPKDSWAVEENREVIITSLSDPDPNIRQEALNLVMNMVFESNMVEITVLLISHALRSDPVFANEILEAILNTCGRNYYEIVQDFDWYVSILGEMARNPHCEKGEEIERQLVDIGLRVRDARPELVRVARDMLIDPALLGNHFLDRILSGAAWVSGEYVQYSKNPRELLEALLQPRTDLLPSLVRAVYIQAVFKVIAYCLSSYIELKEANDSFELSEYSTAESEDDFSTSVKSGNRILFTHDSILYMLNLVGTAVGQLLESDGVEVQERARNVVGLIRMLKGIPGWETKEGLRRDSRIKEIVGLMKGIYSEELGPVSIHAQQKVLIPEGLVLKENLADIPAILGDDTALRPASASFSLRSHHHREIEEDSEPAVESTALLAEHRKRHGLYYLPAEKDEPGSNDYPKANDPLISVSSDASDELLKLTGQTLIPRKAKTSKPRPVIVKLDEDNPPASSKPVEELKDDKLSGAIWDVLSGNKEQVPTPSVKTSSDKSSRRKLKDRLASSEPTSLSKENIDGTGMQENEGSSSRSRQHKRDKDKHRSNHGEGDNKGKDYKNSSKSAYRTGKQKQKHRQRGDAPLDIVPQAPVIQDFLL